MSVALSCVYASLVLGTVDVTVQDLDARYGSFAWKSLILSGLGALFVVVLSVLLAYAGRQRPDGFMRWTTG